MRSTLIAGPISKTDKPWLKHPDGRGRVSWWITFSCILIGIGVAAVVCFFGITGVKQFKDSELCSVMDDQFTGSYNF